MGMSSSLVDSRSPLLWSSNSVARPLFRPFLANIQKIRLSIFPVEQVFVGPLSSYVAEILAPWQHCLVNVWGVDGYVFLSYWSDTKLQNRFYSTFRMECKMCIIFIMET
jgi:hypothetical protein